MFSKKGIFIAVLSFMVFSAPAFLANEALSAGKQYDLAVGSLRGTMGRLGAGLANVINKNTKDFGLSVTPGGGRANPARIGGCGADFGYSFSNFSANALTGKAPYKKSYPNLRGIAKFWDSCYHQYAAKELFDAGITSWRKIIESKKPLKLAPAKKGTSTEYVASQIVKHYGTSYKELTKRGYKLTFPGAGGMSRAIRARQIDFYFHNSGDPNGAGIQAAQGRNLVFLNMDNDVKKLLADLNFKPCAIPGGIYKGNPKPTYSMGLSGVLLTTTKMDAKTVYSLLKIMSANLKTLGSVHKIYKKWKPSVGAAHMGVPMHPGAKRFYKEAGAL